MDSLLNVLLSFFEGFALIISPCILPILPIILAGSLTGRKSRPFGITLGFIVIFTLFTYFSRQLVQLSGLDLTLVRHVSYVILSLLGLIMLSSTLTELFNRLTANLANAGQSLTTANDTQGGFFSGLLFGGLVALIWTPCAGPILAAVIVQTAMQTSNAQSLWVLATFALGASTPMLLIALFGRTITERFHFFKRTAGFFRKLLGLIIILSVGYMIYLEQHQNTEIKVVSIQHPIVALQEGLATPYPAPAILGITDWMNSSPLTLDDLKGKVVLIDFWTYSCINCLRTLPYLKSWYEKYHDKGLVIIGIHAPEFEFEKNPDNVKRAVLQNGLTYPIGLDNHYVTWQNYHNEYWPAHYLIDKTGKVVYTHFGEGKYDVTENNIRYLLGERDAAIASTDAPTRSTGPITPETYLGYARALLNYSNELVSKDVSASYSMPDELTRDTWALSGQWKVEAEQIIAMQAGAAIKLRFRAQKVFVVMGNTGSQPINVSLRLDGQPITTQAGSDVTNSQVRVDQYRLYEILSFPQPNEATVELIADAKGLALYTFTFG